MTQSVGLRPDDSDCLAIGFKQLTLLAMIAGYIDVVGYIDLGIFTGVMTGNTAHLGVALISSDWQVAANIAFVIAAFFSGAVISSIIRRKMEPPVLELIIMAALLAIAQILRLTQFNTPPLEIALLAGAAAMQGETVARFSGIALQTIVVTSNLLKCAKSFVDFCAERFFGAPPEQGKGLSGRKTHWAESALPGLAWVSYLTGACVAALLAARMEYQLILPIVLLFIVIGLTLIFERRKVKASVEE
ncbi:YoaK family protein [Beijerinckia mobilis]|uniref:YoaK family protein n=1 Tax=Beijerinckia mobilis TaxID=231434 RepID=UPI0005516742|nr:YoaK family protein [Beijerinckia mobilis]